MSVVSTLKKKKDTEIAGIDASSTGIAITIISQTNGKAIVTNIYKINLQKIDLHQKLKLITTFFDSFFEKHSDLTHIYIEQPIYIQNPATSRVLSQVSGHIIGTCLRYDVEVTEVVISNWKSFIGYKNVSRAEKEAWIKELGEKEAKKKAATERKERTIRIIHEKVPALKHMIDNDVCDSVGIALWGLDKENNGRNT